MDAFPELHTLNQFELSVVFHVHILQCPIIFSCSYPFVLHGPNCEQELVMFMCEMLCRRQRLFI